MTKKITKIKKPCDTCGEILITSPNRPRKRCEECLDIASRRKYQKTEAYRKSLKKYRESKKYQEWVKRNTKPKERKVCHCGKSFWTRKKELVLCVVCRQKEYLKKYRSTPGWREKKREDWKRYYRSQGFKKYKERNKEKMREYQTRYRRKVRLIAKLAN